FFQAVKIGNLRFWSGLGFVKPIAPIRLPVHADWSADGIAKFSIFEPILAWEYFDPFLETAAFNRNAESEGEIVDVDSAFRGQQRLGAEDPEMPAAARLFQGGVHSVLLQLPLQLKQRLQGAIEVGINRDPLRTLSLGIDRIQADGDVAVQVHSQI